MEAQEGAVGFQSRADLEQAQPEGVDLGIGQLEALQQVGAQGVHQHVGGGMDEQPELVGFLPVADGAVGFQRRLLSLIISSILPRPQ